MDQCKSRSDCTHGTKSFDESIDESESSSNSDDEDKPTHQVEKNTDRYTIMIFGIDELGRSVSVKVDGFEPYFFVYIPEITKKKECEQFVNTLKSNLPKKYQHKAVKHEMWQLKLFIILGPRA